MGAGRWSVPHVPTLALPSLQKLRSLLAEGLVLLDCPAQSFLELVGTWGAFAGRAWATMPFPQDFPCKFHNFPELTPPHPTLGISFLHHCGGRGWGWKNRVEEQVSGMERDLGRGERERFLGQGALRKRLELHLCSSEQVTRVDSLSPELRGQLQALLLQRPQHLIQPTGTRPCQGKRTVFEPSTKSPNPSAPFLDQDQPSLGLYLNSGLMGEKKWR